MGFYFAHLLAYYQSLKSSQTFMDSSAVIEMIDFSRHIINLAIDTADNRTRHLTDHIYHVVTFSALILCQLVYTYEPRLRATDKDVEALDNLVLRLISWLRSIGLSCHVAHLLGEIVSAQFKKLRPGFQPTSTGNTSSTGQECGIVLDMGNSGESFDLPFLYPDLMGSELFYIDEGTVPWPDWS
jgi:hypothetical protein